MPRHQMFSDAQVPDGAHCIDAACRSAVAAWWVMKNIGFLSFGHWAPSPHSQTCSASDALLQSIDLAVARMGVLPGAPFRQSACLAFPLLAAVGARTHRIEIGTAVIDMRSRDRL
jgi:hypothetical protein